MAKLPSFQFYPGDWMKDPALRSVSLASRGLWLDMLCLMFESDRRGYLQHQNGSAVTGEQLARIVGCSAKQVSKMLEELESSGVFSRDAHGMIYSRRMVRDEQVRSMRSEGGKLGGNPLLLNGKVNQGDNLEVNLCANLRTTPSSSSSSSSSKEKTIAQRQDRKPQREEAFMRFWEVYPKKRSKGSAEKAWKSINPGNELIEIILDSVKRAKTSKDWLKEGGKFVPYPATWLRANGWEDEFDVPKSVPSGANGDELRRKILEVQGLLHAEGGVN